MEKMAYLKMLHDIAYQANLADTERKESWQHWSHASEHVQKVLDIVSSMLTDSEYDLFLNCFGCFTDFAIQMGKGV